MIDNKDRISLYIEVIMLFILLMVVIWTEFRDYKRRKNRANLFTHFRLRESINSTDSFVDDTDIVEFVRHNKSLDLRMSKVNWLFATDFVYLLAWGRFSIINLLIWIFCQRMNASCESIKFQEWLIPLFRLIHLILLLFKLVVEDYIWRDSRY